MEPPPFGDGNLPGTGDPPTELHPSMEPPPFGDGNGPYIFAIRDGPRPSMEPPPFGDGNYPTSVPPWPSTIPSMEPPPFGDGNRSTVRPEVLRCGAFNGATALRRWKPSLYIKVLAGFFTFNGATALRRWKLVRPRRAYPMQCHLQWSHRPSAMETSAAQLMNAAQMALQWSHRPSAMETGQLLQGVAPQHETFNGATALRRWKHGRYNSHAQPATSLQWSHRPSAMETLVAHWGRLDAAGLQWSHRPSAMETSNESYVWVNL